MFCPADYFGIVTCVLSSIIAPQVGQVATALATVPFSGSNKSGQEHNRLLLFEKLAYLNDFRYKLLSFFLLTNQNWRINGISARMMDLARNRTCPIFPTGILPSCRVDNILTIQNWLLPNQFPSNVLRSRGVSTAVGNCRFGWIKEWCWLPSSPFLISCSLLFAQSGILRTAS